MRVLKMLGPLSLALCSCSGVSRAPASTAPKPDFRVVAFRPTAEKGAFEGNANSLKITVLEPDNEAQPTAWEGPLKVMNVKTGSQCTASLSLITGAYFSPAADYLIVLTYSGSLRYIHYVSTRSCQDLWPAETAFTEGIQISGSSVAILPGCECPGGLAPCDCSSAKVLQLAVDRPPIQLKEESVALTRKILGVGFEGRRKVLRPKTSSAELAPR